MKHNSVTSGRTRLVARPIPVLTLGLGIEDESRLAAEAVMAGMARGRVQNPRGVAHELTEEQAAEDYFHGPEIHEGFQPAGYEQNEYDDEVPEDALALAFIEEHQPMPAQFKSRKPIRPSAKVAKLIRSAR